MVRIAHFGSYDANVGDNIALLNIRKCLEEVFGQKIAWTNVCISKFHSCKGGFNNIEFAKREFSKISQENDLLIIGGGGLIEANNRKDNHTKWKLPFTAEILSKINIPIVCFSMGINYFRNFPKLDSTAIQRLKELKEHSSLFSLRNDGSADIYQSLYGDLCIELPDPGLVFFKDTIDRKSNLKKGFFQPAWNNNSKQMSGRRYSVQNLKKMSMFCDQFDLDIMPHTKKDYNFPYDRFIYQADEFSKLVKFKNFEKIIQKYFEYDFSVAMRGHGQLISIGLGLPSIYFSTQDKVKNFSLKNGFENYNVDIEEADWENELIKKTNRLIQDSDYLAEWYEIRDKHVIQCKQKFRNFCLEIVKVI